MSIGQQFRNAFVIEDRINNVRVEIPSFTCAHCNTVKAPAPGPETPLSEINARVQDWRRSVAVCRQCDAFVCRRCARHDGVCLNIYRDSERAFEDLYKQPWMLRDEDGDPVYRIFDKDGNVILAKQRDTGYTDRELASIGENLTYDGKARIADGD